MGAGCAGALASGVAEAAGVGSERKAALFVNLLPDGDGVAETAAEAEAAGEAAGAGGASTALPTARTWRNRSSAVCPTRSTTRSPLSPGTEMTICRLIPLPCERTSLSATPSELTR